MADDYSLSSQERLIRLIDEDNGNPGLTSAQVTLGTPEVTTENGRNTKILVTANANTGMTGARTFYYNRLHLDTFFDDLTPNFMVRVANPTNTFDLLPAILATYDVNLGQDDIRQDPVTGTVVNLRSKLNSLAWRGNVQVEVRPPLQALNDLIEFPQMAGFVYENETPIYAIADPYVATDIQLLNLVNNNEQTTLTNTDVTFSALTATAPDIDGRNTSVLMTAQPTGDYTGSITLYYRRVDIETFFPDGLLFNGSTTGMGTTHEILDAVRLATGLELRDDEVENNLLPPLAAQVDLVITANSQVWEPGSIITVYFSTMGQYHILDGDGYHLLDSGEYALLD